jgi:tetratricopeptide (TPR) repeat protein
MRHLLAVLLLSCLLVSPLVAEELVDDDGYAKGLELFRAGRYQQAMPFFQRALDLAEARHGADDPAIAVELNNLAEIHRLTGRLNDAEALYQRAIDLDTRAGRDASPEFATSLNNLALVYRAQGRLEEAEQLHTRSLALLEKSLGPHHPDVARSLNNLAVVYRAEGHPDRARPLQERAVAVAEKALGRRHPTTEALRHNLAALDWPGTAAPAGAVPLPRARPGSGKALAPAEPTAAPPPVRDAAAPTGAGSFAVQVAALRDRAGIRSEWQQQVRRHPVLRRLSLMAPQEVEIPKKGTFYRVFAGPLATLADAEAVCGKLKAAGAYCRAVRR